MLVLDASFFHPHLASPVKGEGVLLKFWQVVQPSAPFERASGGHPLCGWSLTTDHELFWTKGPDHEKFGVQTLHMYRLWATFYNALLFFCLC